MGISTDKTIACIDLVRCEGGVGAYVLEATDELADAGLDVGLACFQRYDGDPRYGDIVKEAAADAIGRLSAALRRPLLVRLWELAEAVRSLSAEDVANSPGLMRVRKAAEDYFGIGKFPTKIKGRVDEEIDERAIASSVDRVTTQGYVKLPDAMLKELGLEAGGDIWFIRSSDQRWEAWNASKLDKELGFK